jgi:hypothetical protein
MLVKRTLGKLMGYDGTPPAGTGNPVTGAMHLYEDGLETSSPYGVRDHFLHELGHTGSLSELRPAFAAWKKGRGERKAAGYGATNDQEGFASAFEAAYNYLTDSGAGMPPEVAAERREALERWNPGAVSLAAELLKKPTFSNHPFRQLRKIARKEKEV